MKDHERYELLYGRPIGVEDPMLQALRMQEHQVQGGIYVEPRGYDRESTGFTTITSMDGTLPRRTDSTEGQGWPHPSDMGNSTVRPVHAHACYECTSGDPVDCESQRLKNMFSFQRCEVLILGGASA